MNQKIAAYLRQNKQTYSREALIDQLKKSGYAENDIQEAVLTVYTQNGSAADGSNQRHSSVSTDPSSQTVKYAGFWIRFAAHIIDSFVLQIALTIIIIIVAIIGGVTIGVVTDGDENNVLWIVFGVFLYIGIFVLTFGYYIYMTHKYQATLGKMAVGIIVVQDPSLSNLPVGKIILRETVGKIVSGLILFIGYIMAGFTMKKQALHDIMAGSVVIYKK